MLTFLRDLLPRLRGEYIDPERDYELKQRGLEALLGPMHGVVGHAIIPYEVGGAVDMYYFPQPDGGTALATMELLDHCGRGPRPGGIGTYELLAFSRHALSDDDGSPFETTERMLCGIFSAVGRYSESAVLNPGETLEIPSEGRETRHVLLDQPFADPRPLQVGRRSHGLLLCIAVHPAELEFARRDGFDTMKQILQENGVYPCSDLEREPLV